MKTFRKKGLDFEREVSKKLSEWTGTNELIFWRTHGSGSAAKLDKKFHGDITSIKEEGDKFTNIFYIECKRYKNFDVGSLLDLRSSYERKLIKEYLQKAKKLSKHLFLVIKRNNAKKSFLFVELPNKTFDFSFFMTFFIDDAKVGLTTLEDFISTYNFSFVVQLWG